MSDSSRPHGLQCVKLPCPSVFPRVCSNSCPLSWWWTSSHLIPYRPLLLLPSIFPSIKSSWVSEWSHLVVSDSLQPQGLTRFLCPWDFPGKNTGVGCHILLQEIFPTQGLNRSFTGRQILYHWATREAANNSYLNIKNFINTFLLFQSIVKNLLDDNEIAEIIASVTR